MDIDLATGDITWQRVDAIVNAANSELVPAGGVSGAIHLRGGPAISDECRRLREERFPDGVPTGEAVATTGGALPARWVIHAVGPVYTRRVDRGWLLRTCYHNALRVADSLGAATVAFPLISAGGYGWPRRDAIAHALSALSEADTGVSVARLMLFDVDTRAVAEDVYRVLVA